MATSLLVAVPVLLLTATVAAAAWWGRYAWRARAVKRRFAAQGVRGPRRGGLLRGCNDEVRRRKAEADAVEMDVRDHDYLRRIVPHFVAWKEQYGAPFLYWIGPQPRICVSDYDLVKQILSNKYGHFVKNDAHPVILSIIGKGLVLVEGTDWVRHRRVLSPAFAMDKLKMMTKTMVACAQNMVKELEDEASSNKNGETQVELDKRFQELTADIISHTAFGSSYKLGIEAFHAQRELQEIAVKTLLNVQIPGFNYLPTKGHRRKWTLEKKLRGTLMQIIQSRLSSKESGYGDDLLGLMLEACIATDQGREQHQLSLSIDEIIHECKTFFFAGYETTSLLLTWTVFLLSVYPEWQARLRFEVLRECGKENPNGDNLSKLKE
ncbi:hypothetical protein E2562_012794, partial [Oryza meyeriana var. granulata]